MPLHEIQHGADGTVLILYMGIPLARIRASKSTIEVNSPLIERLYGDVVSRPAGAPASAAEAFALTVYLSRHSIEELSI